MLEKIDIVQDGHLDKTEFILLALDRHDIFSEENLTALFDYWDDECQGQVSIMNSVKLLFQLGTSRDEFNEDKCCKFYDRLQGLPFCP